MKDPKGLLTREVARILPRHPNIAVDPRLMERLIEKDTLVDVLQFPPLHDLVTNAVVLPHGKERMLIVGDSHFARVAILAAAGHPNPYHELHHLYRFVSDGIAGASYGSDPRTMAKLYAIESEINVHHAGMYAAFNAVLLNRTTKNGAKTAVVRERKGREEGRAEFLAGGEEYSEFTANGDKERTVVFDEFEKHAIAVIATAFRSIYAQKDLTANIGPHRVTIKPAPLSAIDVIGVARRIIDAP